MAGRAPYPGRPAAAAFMLALALLLLAASALAIPPADLRQSPFGLAWGLDQAALDELGCQPTLIRKRGPLTTLEIRRPPRSDLPNTLVVVGFVHQRMGLQKLTWVRRFITDDPRGQVGRAAFQGVEAALSAALGKPQSFQYSGDKLYREPQEFYQCLRHPGCGNWVSFWNTPEGPNVKLQLKGIRAGEGRLFLSLEGPRWREVVAERKGGGRESARPGR